VKILVTGTAGFIGFHQAKKLLDRGDDVVGLDNINDYYDVNLKYARLAELGIEIPNQVGNDGTSSSDFTSPSSSGLTPPSSSGLTRGSNPTYKIYNIGNNAPLPLMTFIETIEKALGKKAEKNFMPMQDGDVVSTYADVSGLINDFGYKPDTKLADGIEEFVKWYLNYLSKKNG
jgi:nucleoside-diphosphate-sugar epimerase